MINDFDMSEIEFKISDQEIDFIKRTAQQLKINEERELYIEQFLKRTGENQATITQYSNGEFVHKFDINLDTFDFTYETQQSIFTGNQNGFKTIKLDKATEVSINDLFNPKFES